MKLEFLLARLRSVPASLAYVRRHPLGRRQPVRVLLRMANWHLRSALRPALVELPWIGGSTLLARSGMTGVTGNVYYGLHEFVEMAFIAMVLRPGDLFADVGANAGTYTVLASKVAGARTRAFEPGDEIGPVLDRHIAANAIGSLVELRREAIGAQVGTVSFTTGHGTMNRIAETGETGVVEVPVTTLDAAFADEAPLAIKLDIEGGEDEAIAGARRLLSQDGVRAILIETVGEETLQALSAAGFVERQFDPFTRRLGTEPNGYSQNNRIFVRDEAFVRDRLATAAPLRVLGEVL